MHDRQTDVSGLVLRRCSLRRKMHATPVPSNQSPISRAPTLLFFHAAPTTQLPPPSPRQGSWPAFWPLEERRAAEAANQEGMATANALLEAMEAHTGEAREDIKRLLRAVLQTLRSATGWPSDRVCLRERKSTRVNSRQKPMSEAGVGVKKKKSKQ